MTLRKALGYCWSVAVAALPIEGKRLSCASIRASAILPTLENSDSLET